MGGKGGRGGAGARRVRRVKGDAGDGGCPAPSSAPPARDAEPAGGTVRRPFAGGCVSWRRRGSFARRGWSGVCCGGGWAHPRRCGEVFPKGPARRGAAGGEAAGARPARRQLSGPPCRTGCRPGVASAGAAGGGRERGKPNPTIGSFARRGRALRSPRRRALAAHLPVK